MTVIINNNGWDKTIMQIQAHFDKINYKQYSEYGDLTTFNDIPLPRRATRCSAGYDFFAPYDITFEAGQTVTIATGIRIIMPEEYFLMIVPRSGFGFKYKLRLNNTVGIIDADYTNSPNGGHIFVRMTNESDKAFEIKKGEAFAQGILLKYCITDDDETTEIRRGGLGSTTKN